jgi:hypothetical protein
LAHNVMPDLQSKMDPTRWKMKLVLPWTPCCLCSLEYGGKLTKSISLKSDNRLRKRRLPLRITRANWHGIGNSYQQVPQFLCMKGHLRGRSWKGMTQLIPCMQPVLATQKTAWW